MNVTRHSQTRHRLLRWVVIIAATGGLIASSHTASADVAELADGPGPGVAATGGAPEPVAGTARASEVEWVDGGDDSPCLNDDTGQALTALPSDRWCTPILGCYQDDDGKYVLPSRSTGIWQGDPADVKYADEIATAPPSSSIPLPPTTPTLPSSPGPGGPSAPGSPTPGGSPAPGSPSAGGASLPGSPSSDDPSAPGGVSSDAIPSPPAAPTLTGTGSDLEVTWAPHADAESDGVTGYVVEISWFDPVDVDASTTAHTVSDVPDGTYLAVVRAVNAFGSSPSSAPSDPVTVGAPVAEVVGTIEVEGSLAPGETVTLVGVGYAPNVPNLQVELHSTPVVLDVVTTDADGAFSTSVTLPGTVEPGDHTIVVIYDGAEVSRTPVRVIPATGPGSDPTESASAAVESAPGAAQSGSDVAEPSASDATPSVVGVVLVLVLMGAAAGGLLWQRRRSSAPAEAADVQLLDVPEEVSPPDDRPAPELQEVP